MNERKFEDIAVILCSFVVLILSLPIAVKSLQEGVGLRLFLQGLFLVNGLLVMLWRVFSENDKILKGITVSWAGLFVAERFVQLWIPANSYVFLVGSLILATVLIAWADKFRTGARIHLLVAGVAILLICMTAVPLSLKQPENSFVKVNATPTGILTGKLNLIDMKARSATINIKERPAVFVAPWCGGCEEILKRLSTIKPSKRPYVVGVYIDPTHLKAEIDKLQEKVDRLAPGSEVYVLLETPPVKAVPGFAYVTDDNQLMVSDNEQTVAGMLRLWNEVLSKKPTQ